MNDYPRHIYYEMARGLTYKTTGHPRRYSLRVWYTAATLQWARYLEVL